MVLQRRGPGQNHLVNIHRKLQKAAEPHQLRAAVGGDAARPASYVTVKETEWLEWCASFTQYTSLADL